MVEQSTSASRALAEETEQLAMLIGGFKIGADTSPRTAALVPRRRLSA